MKTMQNFAAQQLSKKQMNEVKGGDIYCALYYQDSNGNLINEAGLVGGANSTSEAKEMAKSKYTSIGYKLVIADCIED